MTDEEDNASWIAAGRMLSLFDNEALSRYFNTIANLDPTKKAEVVAAFDQAINEGWRPKFAVKRALALVDPKG